MNKAWYAAAVLAAGLGWSGGPAVQAGARGASSSAEDWCREGGGHGGRGEQHCEVREFTLPAGTRVEVDASPNGGVEVMGEARGDVRILARVQVRAGTAEEARALAAQVNVATTGKIHATGPQAGRGASWTVSYRLRVPERAQLGLHAHNGGLHVEGVRGDVQAHTTNGGVHLADVGGRVHARTTNGGLHVALASAWDGEGLDAQTTNGGIHVELPETLDAHLEAATTNGRIHGDLPVTRRGRHGVGGSISTDLGRGGPTLRLVTTNGGVHVTRR